MASPANLQTGRLKAISASVTEVRERANTPGVPFQVVDVDPVGIRALRRRLLFAVLVTATLVTIFAGALGYRLARNTAFEREAAELANELVDRLVLAHPAESATTPSTASFVTGDDAAALAPLEGAIAYERVLDSGERVRWGYLRDGGVVTWGELERGDRRIGRATSLSTWPLSERRREAQVQAVIGSAVIAWIALWVGFLLVHTVTRRLEESSRRLVKVATRDPLTQLPNRYDLESRVQAQLDQHDASGGWMLVVALHNLRSINDTLGHDAGDRVLIEAAVRLHDLVARVGALGRVADDQFAAWLPHLDETTALATAAAIDAALRRVVQANGVNVYIDSTIGLCAYPARAESVGQLLSRADVAATLALRERRHQLVYSPSLDIDSLDQLELRTDLRAALADGSITLHYQPRLDLRTNRWMAVEALARWKHPTRGWVPPPVFIDAAERSGMIEELTYHLLAIAVVQADSLRRLGVDCPIAVNLSPSSLADPAFRETLHGLIAARSLPIAAIQLEITEGVAIDTHKRARGTLDQLAADGFVVAVDDFGTGMSSLAYLRELPVQQLKIDRSFVARLGAAPDSPDGRIVRSIINLAHDLDLGVTAEGVEDDQTLELLRRYGCDDAQGYGIARPMPGRDLETRIVLQGVRVLSSTASALVALASVG